MRARHNLEVSIFWRKLPFVSPEQLRAFYQITDYDSQAYYWGGPYLTEGEADIACAAMLQRHMAVVDDERGADYYEEDSGADDDPE